MSKKQELEQVQKQLKQGEYQQWGALFLAVFVLIFRYLGMVPDLLYYPIVLGCFAYVFFALPKQAKLYKKQKRIAK